MKKAAVIAAEGFEEGETLTIVDILRRAGMQCDMVGLQKCVTGGHHITVQCDRLINEDMSDYDMVILPGGYEGVENLKNSDEAITLLKKMNESSRYVCAMCAAPAVLDQAGLLEGRKFTAYVGYDKKIKHGTYLEDKIVIDGNIITSRGPACAYVFAYKLVDVLGGDSLAVKNRMVYFNAFDVKEDE